MSAPDKILKNISEIKIKKKISKKADQKQQAETHAFEQIAKLLPADVVFFLKVII